MQLHWYLVNSNSLGKDVCNLTAEHSHIFNIGQAPCYSCFCDEQLHYFAIILYNADMGKGGLAPLEML